MKKIAILFVVLAFLVGCSDKDDDTSEIVQEDESSQQQTTIVPSHRLTDESYRIILPFETSEARGVITNQMGNRVDIDELEQGLMRHSREHYDPSEMYYQEGQYLTKDHVFQLIDELNPQIDEEELEKSDKDTKIKTYEDNPRYLTHILEQNYLQRNEDNTVEIAGISLGIALKSVYRFQTEIGGPYYYKEIPEKEMLEQGEKIAQQVVNELKALENFPDVPIMIALFREAEQNSPVPGNFVSKTFVPAGSSSIGKWERINERNILFPSSVASSEYTDDNEIINSFGNEIALFFPNYVGYIGRGFYINDELQKLTIEVPLEFYGKAEVIGFTQYAYSLVQDTFSKNYALEIKVTSSEGMESIIIRDAGEDETKVHIFD